MYYGQCAVRSALEILRSSAKATQIDDVCSLLMLAAAEGHAEAESTLGLLSEVMEGNEDDALTW